MNIEAEKKIGACCCALRPALNAHRLSQFADSFSGQGYHTVEDLCPPNDPVDQEWLKKIGMKSGHLSRFRNIVQNRAPSARDPGAVKDFEVLLKQVGLDGFVGPLAHHGYEVLADIRNESFDDGELKKIFEMQMGHRKRFQRLAYGDDSGVSEKDKREFKKALEAKGLGRFTENLVKAGYSVLKDVKGEFDDEELKHYGMGTDNRRQFRELVSRGESKS